MNAQELRKLEAEATPGPWDVTVDGYIHADLQAYVADVFQSSDGEYADAALIAVTRNVLPLLLDLWDAAKSWRQWSDDGEGYIEAEQTLADALAALDKSA